jgi:hypothetical protein
MNFLMTVLAVTVVSAVGWLLMQDWSKSSSKKEEAKAPAPPAPAPKAEEPPPQQPKPDEAPPPPKAPALPPLSYEVERALEKLERQVESWKPTSHGEVVKSIKYEVLEIIKKRERQEEWR